MKLIALFISFFCFNTAFATVDVQGEVTIVVSDYNSDGEYFLRTVPTDYCVGIDSYAIAMAITMPVTINSGYGCGAKVSKSQVNEATCAKINVEEVELSNGSIDTQSIKVRKDLSKCGEKSRNIKFVEALDNAIKNSFISKGYKIVELK